MEKVSLSWRNWVALPCSVAFVIMGDRKNKTYIGPKQ